MNPSIESYDTVIEDYDPSNNISKNIMTKYEKTALIGTRMEQLARGAPSVLPKSELNKLRNVEAIATQELVTKKMPLMVVRKTPNGKKEYYKVEDLIIKL